MPHELTPPASTARDPAASAFPQAGTLQWLLPVLILFWVWRYALRCWLIADDFAWPKLLGSVHSFRDFLRAMFAPMAQSAIGRGANGDSSFCSTAFSA
jgi:hypothetical protein